MLYTTVYLIAMASNLLAMVSNLIAINNTGSRECPFRLFNQLQQPRKQSLNGTPSFTCKGNSWRRMKTALYSVELCRAKI